MDPLTLSVAPISPIKLDGDQTELSRSSGTAFFWEFQKHTFLITNWHNVTGLNPETLQPIGSFIPTHVDLYLKYKLEEGERTYSIGNRASRLPLYKKEQPVWLEHPNGHQVDCVALLLEVPDADKFVGRAINRLDFTQSYTPNVGDECFIIGYPQSMMGPGRTPIWKRGSISTEPSLDFNQRPILLVDTATRSGMSGSPVIARHHGIHMPSGEITGDSVVGTVQNFLGIYSGRIGDDELGVQLGRVWKSHLVEEILAAGSRGVDPKILAYTRP